MAQLQGARVGPWWWRAEYRGAEGEGRDPGARGPGAGQRAWVGTWRWGAGQLKGRGRRQRAGPRARIGTWRPAPGAGGRGSGSRSGPWRAGCQAVEVEGHWTKVGAWGLGRGQG